MLSTKEPVDDAELLDVVTRRRLNAYSDAVAAVELPDVDAEIQARILEARMAFSLVVEGMAN